MEIMRPLFPTWPHTRSIVHSIHSSNKAYRLTRHTILYTGLLIARPIRCQLKAACVIAVGLLLYYQLRNLSPFQDENSTRPHGHGSGRRPLRPGWTNNCSDDSKPYMIRVALIKGFQNHIGFAIYPTQVLRDGGHISTTHSQKARLRPP